jgi:hypothetical protein
MFEEGAELGHGQALRMVRASSPVPFRVPETSASGQGGASCRLRWLASTSTTRLGLASRRSERWEHGYIRR